MEKIVILGPPGTGKTTLSLRLSEILGLTPLHLDAVHFEANWILRDKVEVKKELKEFMNNNEKWVMDGNWRHCLPMRLEEADTVIYLDYGLQVSMNGVLERYSKNKGKPKPDIPQCFEKIDDEFIEHIENFEEPRGRELKEKINNLGKNIEVHIFKTREECDLFLKTLQ